VGEDRRDSETAQIDQCWLVVAGMGQWWSEKWVSVSSQSTALNLGNQNASKVYIYMGVYGPPLLIYFTSQQRQHQLAPTRHRKLQDVASSEFWIRRGPVASVVAGVQNKRTLVPAALRRLASVGLLAPAQAQRPVSQPGTSHARVWAARSGSGARAAAHFCLKPSRSAVLSAGRPPMRAAPHWAMKGM
jgi:hypothetical protein